MASKKVQEWKKKTLEKLVSLMSDYKVMAIASLYKVRASQIQELRRRLNGKVEFLVAKNTLVQKAIENLKDKKHGLEGFNKALKGSNILLFTNIDAYELSILLNKSKVKVFAKPGDIAINDIIVPAGNTGFPPGPIISDFNELKVPTKIESGSIMIVKDTVVARKGDVISAKLASILGKLGIKPIEVGLELLYAYEEGLILGPEELKLDLEAYKKDIFQAHSEAFRLAINMDYLTKETVQPILNKAYIQAMQLSIEAEYPIKENIFHIIQKAYTQATNLFTKLSSIDKTLGET
ncbi:MAG: 50S ribosomal protein L10 [Candidatus Bathyarchaeia archaeon]